MTAVPCGIPAFHSSASPRPPFLNVSRLLVMCVRNPSILHSSLENRITLQYIVYFRIESKWNSLHLGNGVEKKNALAKSQVMYMTIVLVPTSSNTNQKYILSTQFIRCACSIMQTASWYKE